LIVHSGPSWLLSSEKLRDGAPLVLSGVIGPRSVDGTVLVSVPVRATTSKRITSPPERQLLPELSLTDVPTATFEKSMTSSARSAGDSGTLVRDSDDGSSPPSLATWTIACEFDSRSTR
jgi:hypothetical protein